MNWLSLLAANALRWYARAYAGASARLGRAVTATQSLFRRFPTVDRRALESFADKAQAAVAAARRLNQSSRPDYRLPRDATPNVTRQQRREGARGPTLLEIGVSFEVVYTRSDGTAGSQWFTDRIHVPPGSNRSEIMQELYWFVDKSALLFRGDTSKLPPGSTGRELGRYTFLYAIEKLF